MGIIAGIRAAAGAVIGRPTELPAPVVARYPELGRARWRRGGLPVRIGGWCLGQRSVSAITLWHTIWLAHDITPTTELLLHELRHVDQFEASAAFPLLYLWESVRRGYVKNRFEVEARAFAASRTRDTRATNA
ncbi:MAG TPA: hypothetical protein VHB25_11135 [Gemmatimonadaceae bacterium]|nr:hypothetical protein [Gemmatimonadaceae bacterium]